MSNWLVTLLSLSLSGSLVALILFASMPLLRRGTSHAWRYYIWLLVLVRLLLPIGPEKNLMQALGDGLGKPAPPPAVSQLPPPSGIQVRGMTDAFMWEQMGEMEIAPSEPDDTGEGPGLAVSGAMVAAVIWLGVACVLLAGKLISFMGLTRALKRTTVPCDVMNATGLTTALCRELGIQKTPAIRTSPQAPSPMLAGMLRPFVILPSDCLESPDLRYILLHELVHLRRRDMIYKWLAQFTVCVHWFNPVVYLVQREIGRRCELACDEAVMSRVGKAEKVRYGETILFAIPTEHAGPRRNVSLSMSADKKLLKERLEAIMGFRKRNKLAVCLSVVLAATLLCGTVYAGKYKVAAPSPAIPGGEGGVHSLPTITIKGETWYRIDNEAQLRGLSGYPMDLKYMLNADITLDKAEDWIPVGTRDNPFTGVFTGNGLKSWI